jgi:hypothetical protein
MELAKRQRKNCKSERRYQRIYKVDDVFGTGRK